MNVFDIPVRPGQVWGDAEDMRELTVRRVDKKYAYCISDSGRRTRILKNRMRPVQGGYYLKSQSPAHYEDAPSDSINGKTYGVWTGDEFSPAHCPCKDFRWSTRTPGEPYYCKHLKRILFGKEAA